MLVVELSAYQIKGQPLADLFPEDVLSTLKVVSYEKGDAIALSGQELTHLYIVLSGHCAVKQIGQDGQETVIGYVYAGDLLGEIELFTEYPFLHYIYAETAVALLWIPAHQVKTALMECIPFLHYMLESSFGKLLTRTTYFADTRLYGHQSRTVTYIKDVAERLGSNEIPFVLTEVAPFIGVSERQLRRIIKALEASGQVTKHYRTLEIHDL